MTGTATGDAPARAGERARALFDARTHLCSGAVLAALNSELGGGLDETQAASLAAGFGHAMGGSGCLCGAVSGAVLGLGLFLAPQGDGAVRRASARLHETFRAANGSTCCRVLCKRAPSRRARLAQCAALSAGAAEAAARIILERRPELSPVGSRRRPRAAQAPGRVRRLLRRLLRRADRTGTSTP
ncbi:MAG: C_GCAxxG_C_C family protein [Desulfovibrionaceae bacterium]|nr:C_GCAxxG_C_C family protein [Desulfovibrionaceae bacterium]